MIVVGIDPSLTATGIAVLRDGQPEHPRCIGYGGKRGASDIDRARRVVALVREVTAAVRAKQPDLVVIEGPAYGSTLGSSCDRNFLWGALVHEFGVVGPMKYAGVTPACLKRFATGKGALPNKLPVVRAVNRWWPHLNLRAESVSRMQDNEADAMVLATMGAARYEPHLLPFELESWHPANLGAVAWPITV